MKLNELKRLIYSEVRKVLKVDVSQEIFKQLGGNRFVMMTGAKNIAGGPSFLSFKLPKAKDGINYVKIKLNSMDTYDIEFGRIRHSMKSGSTYKVIHSVDGIYNDQLQEIFTQYTGLYTRL